MSHTVHFLTSSYAWGHSFHRIVSFMFLQLPQSVGYHFSCINTRPSPWLDVAMAANGVPLPMPTTWWFNRVMHAHDWWVAMSITMKVARRQCQHASGEEATKGGMMAPPYFIKRKQSWASRSRKPSELWLLWPTRGIFLTSAWNSLLSEVELRTWGVLTEPSNQVS